MHFFLECMCFTGKGMCSSAMSNAPDGSALYCSAGISSALHIHSPTATHPAGRHRPCPGWRVPAPGSWSRAGKREGPGAMPTCWAHIRGARSRGGCWCRQARLWHYTQGMSLSGMQRGMQLEVCPSTLSSGPQLSFPLTLLRVG